MKEELLGLNHLLSFFATCQTVRPRSSAPSSGHLRMAPPKSSSGMPRCFRYHAASAAWSPLVLKNTPPTPVTLAIVPPPFTEPPDAHGQRHARYTVATSSRPASGCQLRG